MTIKLIDAHTKPTFVISSPACHHPCSLSRASGDKFHMHQESYSCQEETCTYQVAWAINPHMKIGQVNVAEALREHDQFRRSLFNAGATILQVPFVHAAYDSVFVKDSAVLGYIGNQAVAYLCKPKCEQRRKEQHRRSEDLSAFGFEIVASSEHFFEGGDLVVSSSAREAFLGVGFRSSPEAAAGISRFLKMPVIPLELVDPHWYHLDTALAILKDGTAFGYEKAFKPESWARIQSSKAVKKLIPISREEAMSFALNWVEIGDTVVTGTSSSQVANALRKCGKKVRVLPLQQFQLAGGSAACLAAPIYGIH